MASAAGASLGGNDLGSSRSPALALPRRSLRQRVRRNAIAYAFIAPTVLAMLLVHLIPSAQALYMSLLDLKQTNLLLYLRAPFVGLQHYQAIVGGLVGGSDDVNISALGQALNNTLW